MGLLFPILDNYNNASSVDSGLIADNLSTIRSKASTTY